METRTITIKSFEKTSGTKKDQTEWHRISIKATDGKFYSSFKPIAEAALAPGAQLQLQVVQSKIKENTYAISHISTPIITPMNKPAIKLLSPKRVIKRNKTKRNGTG